MSYMNTISIKTEEMDSINKKCESKFTFFEKNAQQICRRCDPGSYSAAVEIRKLYMKSAVTLHGSDNRSDEKFSFLRK